MDLIAYRIGEPPHPEIVPAPVERAWMGATNQGFAKRCLPMLMANTAGWWLLNPHRFVAVWNGDRGPGDTALYWLTGDGPRMTSTLFGHGILTWHVPYLFRTPAGVNLHVRGPANWPKDGASPCEGIVETDWATATFTMNWQLTRPYQPVLFAEGEPFCQIAPVGRGALDEWTPIVRPIASDPDLAAAHAAWAESRIRFNEDLQRPGSDAQQQGWQRHYVRGVTVDGDPAPAHETKQRLRPFVDRSRAVVEG